MKKSSLILALPLLVSACGGGGGPDFKAVTVDVEKLKFNPPDMMQTESTSAFYTDDSNPGKWKALKLFEAFTLLGLTSDESLMTTNISLAKANETLMKADISKRKVFLEIKASYEDLLKDYNLKAKSAINFGSLEEKNLVYNYDNEKKTQMNAVSPIVIRAYDQVFADVLSYMNLVEKSSADGVFDAQDFPAVEAARSKMDATIKAQSEIIKKEKNILIERFLRETNKPRYVVAP